jgi:hypothetical protein
MLRSQMDRLRPIFELAVAGDPTIAVQFPSLAALLGAKQAIAQRSALTRKAKAEGKPQTHGVVGKKRKKAAEKAAYAAPAEVPVASVAAPAAEAPSAAVAVPP